MLSALGGHWTLWEAPRLRPARLALLAAVVVATAFGLPRLEVDDNVQHMQDMPPDLKHQEAEIQRLTGNGGAAQFVLVRAVDAEAALQVQEALLPRLAQMQARGLLAGFQAPAQFIPSQARQRENADLVTRALMPLLPSHIDAVGLSAPPQLSREEPLLLTMLPNDGPLALVSALVLEPKVQLVLLHGLTDVAALRSELAGMAGVQIVSLVDDWSSLFGIYRRQALGLLGFSVLLMLPLLIWRYRWAALRVLAPSAVAVLVTPPIAALFGLAFTFFNAMALVLVLSIGVDYAVFCRETPLGRRGVTALAILLAAASTTLSFGMLAASQVFAVQAFGATMLIGISIAWLLAPIAGGRPE
jgi:predicted exporter